MSTKRFTNWINTIGVLPIIPLTNSNIGLVRIACVKTMSAVNVPAS